MAKIQYSGIGVTEARGKAQDLIYSRNRGGNYYKAWSAPTYPNSSSQQIFAQAMAQATQLWQTLDPSIQQLWIEAATKTQRANVLKKQYVLSGFNLFVSQFFNISLAGGIPSLLPVKPSFLRYPVGLSIDTLDPSNFFVTINIAGAGAIMPPNMSAILFATSSISSGITTKQSGYAGFFQFLPGDTLVNADVLAEYTSLYPTPSTGDKIFIRAKTYHQVTGQSSNYLYTSSLVS